MKWLLFLSLLIDVSSGIAKDTEEYIDVQKNLPKKEVQNLTEEQKLNLGREKAVAHATGNNTNVAEGNKPKVEIVSEVGQNLSNGAYNYRAKIKMTLTFSVARFGGDRFIAIHSTDAFFWTYNEKTELTIQGASLPVSQAVASWMTGPAEKDFVEQCSDFIAVGVASKKGDLKTEAPRASARAANLGNALKAAVKNFPGGSEKRFWQVTLGQYQGSANDRDNQRPVILIGVIGKAGERKEDLKRQLLNALDEEGTAAWIDRKNYSNKNPDIEQIESE